MKTGFILFSVLLTVSAASANPTPGPYGNEIGFAVMQTLEFTYHAEFPVGEQSKSTVILYGGPTVVYVWSPGD